MWAPCSRCAWIEAPPYPAPRDGHAHTACAWLDRFTKTIPDGAAVAEPAAATPAPAAAGDEKPKPGGGVGKLAAPTGLGAMLSGPPGGLTATTSAQGPKGLGALLAAGGPAGGSAPKPPPGRSKSMGKLPAPAGLGAIIGGGGPPSGRVGGSKGPAGLADLLSAGATPPGKPQNTTMSDEPTTPIPVLDHSVAKSRAHGPKSTPRQRRPSKRRNPKRSSLGTPPAMDPPVLPPEPEPEGDDR